MMNKPELFRTKIFCKIRPKFYGEAHRKTARGAYPMIQHKVIMDKVNIKTFKVSA